MANVIWTKRAQTEKRKFLLKGLELFGPITADKMAHKMDEIADDMSRWPTAGFPEPLLRTFIPLFRARHINDRFKIIYWYDEPNDKVVIEDIWDTRRSPENLLRRMKNLLPQ